LGCWQPRILFEITDSLDSLAAKFANLERIRAADPVIDEAMCGYHLEGPWLSPEAGYRGAHDPQFMGPPSLHEHVIADKPLCTSLEELEQIETLAKARGLCVGLMLDLRDHGHWIALREVVQSGHIGEIQTVSFSGQHPLMWGSRPAWYFESGMHGGTLNDIAIHAIDFIPWLTGLEIEEIVAARAWNAKATEAPHFRDCAQLMLRLSNGGGVLGDVSYLAPDACGYAMPNYWRVTLHGTSGLAETSVNAPGITVADDSSKEAEQIPAAPGRPGGYLGDFLAEIAGTPTPLGLTTKSNLRATHLTLELEGFSNPPNFPCLSTAPE
jgi:predicted dehydrogenase